MTPEERKELRLAVGLSGAQLAELAGVCHKTIVNWERPGWKPPEPGLSGVVLEALARAAKRVDTKALRKHLLWSLRMHGLPRTLYFLLEAAYGAQEEEPKPPCVHPIAGIFVVEPESKGGARYLHCSSCDTMAALPDFWRGDRMFRPEDHPWAKKLLTAAAKGAGKLKKL